MQLRFGKLTNHLKTFLYAFIFAMIAYGVAHLGVVVHRWFLS
jgi:hypothetical protein